MAPQTRQLILTMKECNKKINLAVMIGGIVHDIEVTPNSFIQFVQYQGAKGWAYNQGKYEILPDQLKELFLGAFLNETIGNFKIIGIYDWQAE